MSNHNRPVHSYFSKELEKILGQRLSGTTTYNSRYAMHIERRIREVIGKIQNKKKEEVDAKIVFKAYQNLLQLAIKDDWMRPKLKSLDIIYRNFDRLIQS